VDHPGDERLTGRVAVDAVDDAQIELHVIRTELEDMAQAGESGTGVVDGQADPRPEPLERRAPGRVITDLDVLRELEDDLPTLVSEDRGQRLAGENELG